MRANTLEDIVPGLREARDRERANRAMAFIEVTWTVCGLEVVVLTPRHRLEFQLVRNSFAIGGDPSRADVLQFLWRLHPRFKKKVWLGSLAWFARRRTARVVRALDLREARKEIMAYLATMLQDLPEAGEGRDTINAPEQYVFWLAAEMQFYLSRYHGFSMTTLMDTPYLVLQQLYRAYRLAHEAHPNFINESDRLIGRWQEEQQRKRAQPD